MELRDYFRVLRSSWLLIIILLVVGAFSGAAAGVLQPKQYQATAQAFVSVPTAQSLSDLTSGVTFAQQAARGYADITDTSYVLQPVIDRLDLRTTPAGLARRTTVAVGDQSPVITVTVTDAFASRAAKTANAIVSQLSSAAVSLTPAAGTTTTTGSVKLTAVDPAVIDRTPIGLRTPVLAAVGALVGLALAVLIGLVRELLDTRVRTQEDLGRVTAAPLIGTTYRDPQVARSPLVVNEAATSSAAEAYRTLRTNLLFVGLDDSRRSLVLTSSVEGEGKSTTAANLALAVSSLGVRVLLVDADLRRPRLAQYFGLEGAVGLTDVLIGAATLEQAVQRFGQDDLEVLPAGTIPPNPNEQMQSPALHDLVNRLHARYDLVVFDSPPLLPVSDAALLGRLAGGVLVVAAAGRVRRPQLQTALETLDRVGASASGLILTMVPRSSQEGYGYGYASGTASPDAAEVPATGSAARDEAGSLDEAPLESPPVTEEQDEPVDDRRSDEQQWWHGADPAPQTAGVVSDDDRSGDGGRSAGSTRRPLGVRVPPPSKGFLREQARSRR